MTDKAMKKVANNLKKQIKVIIKHPTGLEVYKLNRMIVGAQNYYKIATHVNKDFNIINYNLLKCQDKLLKIGSDKGIKTEEYKNRYKGYKGKEIYVNKNIIYNIYGIKTSYPKLINQNICNYTKEGRALIHDKLGYINNDILNKIANNPIQEYSVELNDNRLSLYTAQKGLCAISNIPLNEDFQVHHIKPKSQGGTDEYKNLILIDKSIHVLIHATKKVTINKYLDELKPNVKVINKLNKYRIKVGNDIIEMY